MEIRNEAVTAAGRSIARGCFGILALVTGVTVAIVVAKLNWRIGEPPDPSTKVTTLLTSAVTELRKTPKLVVLTVMATAHVEKISNKQFWLIDLGTTRVWVKAPGKLQYVICLDGINTDWFDYRPEDGTIELTVPEPHIDDDMIEIDPARIEVIKQIGWARTSANSGQFLEQCARQEIMGQLVAAGGSELLHERAKQEAQLAIHQILAPAVTVLGQDINVDVRFRPEE
jgi:Protein of unknown function (DUF4230)